MPAYELLCLCAPALGKQQLGNIVQRVASVLYSKQAVITDVKSYGDTPLAYKIKGTRGKYEQAGIWQLDFTVAPEALKAVNHELHVNESVLRWAVVKKQQYPPLHEMRRLLQLQQEQLQGPHMHYDSASASSESGGDGGSPQP